MRHALSPCYLLLLATLAIAQQAAISRSGQAIYIVAIKSNTGAPDLTLERKVKEEFEKQKVFKIAPKLADADLVFLVLAEYEYNQAYVGGVGVGSEDMKGASAFALSPSVYTQSKSDLDALRNGALWQDHAKNGYFRMSAVTKNLVKKFHEQALKKK